MRQFCIVIALFLDAVLRQATADMRFHDLAYPSERACIAAGKLPAEQCANAAANARAEFDEKAPKFTTREACQKLFAQFGCSIGFSGSGEFAGKKSGIYYTPRQQGFRIASSSKLVTPYTEASLGFAPRSIMRRDVAIHMDRARQEKPISIAPSNPDLIGRRLYIDLIRMEAENSALPVDVADAVAYVESAYDPSRIGDVGEIGLMQVRPATAYMLGFRGSESELADPGNNIRYGVLYLAQAWRLAEGDLCRALTKYRAGHGAEEMTLRSVEYCSRAKAYLEGVHSPLALKIESAASCEPGVGRFVPRCRAEMASAGRFKKLASSMR